MKYAAAIILNLWALTAIAQTTYKGKITDRDLQPVPYAIVQVAEQKETAVYCDALGNFSIDIDKNKATTFSFYCSGYKTRNLPIRRLNPNSILIKLDANTSNTDNEQSGGSKTDYLGDKGISNKSLVKKEKNKSRVIGDYADEYAVSLKSDNEGLLNRVFVYVTEYAQPKTAFRLHIYAQGENKQPGEELTNANIIAQANKGNEWISFDVSQFNINPAKGVFISTEWVNGRKENTAAPEPTVAIGLTEDYDKEGHITYYRNHFTNKWEKYIKKTEGKEAPLNLMVYGEYSYEK